jgi:hypothetical protein
MKSKKFLDIGAIFLILILAFFMVVTTKYQGSTDVGDYSSIAKFFSGDYKADIRGSHSYFYGFMNAPFVKLTQSFIGMKIFSLIWIILIILSIYYISKKDKRVLLILLVSPIFWYMVPWINSIQIASLFFLWGFYFLKKYDVENQIKYLIYSGVFVGLAWVFWDTVLYLFIILIVSFFYNKKASHLLLFFVFVLIGLVPRLILDQLLFNFAFFTMFKSFIGGLTNSFFGGISGTSGHTPKTFLNILSILLILPLFTYLVFIPKYFKENKKTCIFLILSLILIFSNPQIRYTLILAPIIILTFYKNLSEKSFRIIFVISIVISILVVIPYFIQIKYSTNGEEFTSLIGNIGNLKISDSFEKEVISEDLIKISKDFPNQTFIVGDYDDYYSILAEAYWGEEIEEFVSIQDYNLFLKNETVIFEKEFHPIPTIKERREIWLAGGISKGSKDTTDYNRINYAISSKTEMDLKGFNLVKSYKTLNVFEKS